MVPVAELTRPTQRPRFVESRHTISLHPAAPPPPVPVRPVAPPAPPPPPPPPRPPGGIGKVLAWAVGAWLLLLGGAQVLPALWDSIESSAGGSADTRPSTTPCPEAVASFIPEYGTTLIARYRSAKHEITLCRGPSGQAYYDGVVIGKPRSGKWHISLTASVLGGGEYTAVNGVYRYRVTGTEVIITRNGEVIGRAAVERVA